MSRPFFRMLHFFYNPAISLQDRHFAKTVRLAIHRPPIIYLNPLSVKRSLSVSASFIDALPRRSPRPRDPSRQQRSTILRTLRGVLPRRYPDGRWTHLPIGDTKAAGRAANSDNYPDRKWRGVGLTEPDIRNPNRIFFSRLSEKSQICSRFLNLLPYIPI